LGFLGDGAAKLRWPFGGGSTAGSIGKRLADRACSRLGQGRGFAPAASTRGVFRRLDGVEGGLRSGLLGSQEGLRAWFLRRLAWALGGLSNRVR
jgi:hypothetical protein